VKNPAPVRPEKRPFETWDEIEAVADEIDPRFRALIIFAAGTGLRPGEWTALERRDLDLNASPPSVIVRRRLTKDGRTVDATKNGKHRRVPLRPKALEALEAHPTRLDSRLLFPAARGGIIDLHNWREDYWHPAMVAAGFVTEKGKPDRGPYSLRHTFATLALRAGIPAFDVSRLMGCSVEMIEKHYGHVTNDAAEWALDRLSVFDSEASGRKADARGAGE
jgi:integrase